MAFLWLGEGSARLSRAARSIVLDPANRLLFSAISAWEIHLKASLGKLPLPADPATYIRRIRIARNVESVDFSEDDASHLTRLPDHHRDPFDRALVSQALARSFIILTPDDALRAYPVATVW